MHNHYEPQTYRFRPSSVNGLGSHVTVSSSTRSYTDAFASLQTVVCVRGRIIPPPRILTKATSGRPHGCIGTASPVPARLPRLSRSTAMAKTSLTVSTEWR